MKKNRISKVFAGIAAAALASAMMAPAAFAAEFPSTDGTTNVGGTGGTADTNVYVQVVDSTVLSVDVPTNIYLAVDKKTEKENLAEFIVPDNVKFTNRGKAAQVSSWAIDESTYTKAKASTATLNAANEFYLTAKTQNSSTPADISVSGSGDAAWKMTASGTSNATLDLTLAGKIYSATATDSTMIETITWTIAEV